MKFTQEVADKLKNQTIDVQIRTLLECLECESIDSINKTAYLQFEDLLRDLKVANRKVDDSKGDFYQLRVDEVMRMRGLKN